MIPLVQTFRTVVLANGAFPEHPVPLALLHDADRVICCDGATEHLLKFGRIPDFIVGDLDSISDDLKARFATILVPVSEQETNDLTKAVHFCLAHGWSEITILGATGKREDHTLGNLSLLADYAQKSSVQLLTDYGVFAPQLQRKATYESHVGQQISLFSLNPSTFFTTTNLAYPLENRALTSWWQGTLNEAEADFFTVEINDAHAEALHITPVLIFREF
ncbi:thiamine pyrophosphokinase [Bacteroidia bacterium]|nr:thiamine pyrophosphokinase [Bacteroidia bacterium]GHT01883.1 thiamine pyrophosphokinase [Bacteroidia bacterium]